MYPIGQVPNQEAAIPREARLTLATDVLSTTLLMVTALPNLEAAGHHHLSHINDGTQPSDIYGRMQS